MKSISLKTKIVTGLITGGMLLSSVSLAFAGTTTTKTEGESGKASFKNEFRQQKGNMASTLKLGVSSNIITQAESDKILAYESSKVKTTNNKDTNKTEKSDIYTELVTNSLLTQAQADALKSSEQVQREAKMQEALETKLATLVTDSTITQAQSDQIKAAMVKEEASNKADFEKIKAMTKEERTAYMEANKATHINPLKALVDSGVITQAQADKVGFGAPGKSNGQFQNHDKKQPQLETKLATLVTDSTITQAQSDQIKAAMVKEEASNKADFEKIKAMTKEERTAYMEANKATHINPLKALVDSGVITQAQADKIGHSGTGEGRHMSGFDGE